MTPLGWRWAGLVWAYAMLWFLFNDRLKLAAYYWLDHHRSRETAKPDYR
jgi:H+-transporting ATPase